MHSLKERMKEIEKGEIILALSECNWVMARAAKKLGITERMIGYKIKKYGIQKRGVNFSGALNEYEQKNAMPSND